MTKFIDTLRHETDVFRIEAGSEGWVLVRRTPDCGLFDGLVRTALDNAGEEYAAVPVSDGGTGYERLVIIPFD